MNQKRTSAGWILRAAVAAVPMLAIAAGASAQFRVDTGNSNDANNRVGSGGRNPDDAGRRTGVPSGNDLITGNVTGGKEFRGHVPYRNVNEFRGRTGGDNLDSYIRSSAGAGTAADMRMSEEVRPFYGAARTVNVPPGFQQVAPGTGAYVPSPVQTYRPAGDQRMGAVNLAEQHGVLPAPGELLLPGPVDPTSGQQYISASPLTGIRQMNPNDPGVMGTLTNTKYDPQTGQLTAAQIQGMRDELRADWTPEGAVAPKAPGAPGEALPAPVLPEGETEPLTPGEVKPMTGRRPVTNAKPVIQQPVGGVAQPIVQKPVDTSVAADGLETNQSLRQRILPPPEKQSSVYAELWKRHRDAAADREISDVEAARAFNAAQAQQKKQATAGGRGEQPGAPGGAQPGRPGQPDAAAPVPPSDQAAPGAAPAVTDFSKRNEEILKRAPGEKREVVKKIPVPVKVPSLGQGIKSKGLTDIMSQAEALMKDGKFTAALDQYDQAEQVAPNNPLVKLGRANAELGAAYYARAEAHLREVFTKNPELLVGQYDLAAWLGEPRLQALIKDLKEIANKEQREPRPVFLLAYISYNTGNEQQADAYLDLADKRSGGADPFYKLLRDNWALPEQAPRGGAAPATAPAPMNK